MKVLARTVRAPTTAPDRTALHSAGGSLEDDPTFMVTAGTEDAPKRVARAYIQSNDFASTRRLRAKEGIPDDPVPTPLRRVVDAGHALGGAVTDRQRDGRTAETAR
jgi:hypothetical protein